MTPLNKELKKSRRLGRDPRFFTKSEIWEKSGQKFNLENFLLQFIKTGIFIILFLPLYVNPNFLYPLVFPRTIIFRLIIEICFAAYLWLIIIQPKFRPRQMALVGLISLFILIQIISAFFGVNPFRSFFSSMERTEGIITWLHFLLFFIILTSIFKTKVEWRNLLNLTLIASIFQSLYALAQWLNLSPALKTSGQRLGAAIGNPSFFATYLIFIIFIAIYLLHQEKSKIKIFYASLIIIDLFLLWQTETRGAILALIFSLLFILFVILFRQKGMIRVGALFFLILLISVSIFFYLNRKQPWLQQLPTINRLVNISLTDITAQNRVLVWQTGWQAFLAKPIFGWGWENFNAAANVHFNPLLARDIGSHPWYDRAHNFIVEIGVTTGLIGLIAYWAIIIFTFKLIWQAKNNFWPNLILTALIVAYLIQNIFVFDTLNSYLLFFLVLALIQFQSLPQEKKPPEKTKIIFAGQSLILFFCLLAIFVISAFWLNLRPTLANYYTAKAVTKDKTNVSAIKKDFEKAFAFSNVKQSELRFILIQATRDRINLSGINQETLPLLLFAIEEMKKNISAAPYEIQNYLLLGELYLASSEINPNYYLTAAEEISQKALMISPKRYQTLTLLGRVKMSEAKFTEGITYFQKAIDLNPKFAEAYWNLGIAYVLSRKPAEAKAALDQAFNSGLNIYQPEYVNKILAAYKDSRDLKATIEFLESLTKRFPQNQEYQTILKELKDLYQQAIENK